MAHGAEAVVHQAVPNGVSIEVDLVKPQTNSSCDPATGVCTLTISVDAAITRNMFQAGVYTLQHSTHIYGFPKGSTSASYLETAYRPQLMQHVREFLTHYIALPTLHNTLVDQRIVSLAEPEIQKINIDLDGSSTFTCTIPAALHAGRIEWKKINFKAPGRKNYKDLDRQVVLFLQEHDTQLSASPTARIAIDDWVELELCLQDPRVTEPTPLLGGLTCRVWVRIGHEEVDNALQQLLVGKTIGYRTTTTCEIFQTYFSAIFQSEYPFGITVLQHVPYQPFDLTLFKQQFKIKTPKEVHQKLIEVFSYRNDLSQRRETVEKLFKTLNIAYPSLADESLVLEQQARILTQLQENPDYQVYKSKSDFHVRVKELAQKQIREILCIDSIAYQEQISCVESDLLAYFNLFKRARTREFVYFLLPPTKCNDQELPIDAALVRRYCLKEKTLNHVLAYLVKRS